MSGGKTINERPTITPEATDNLVAQKATQVTGKFTLSDLEAYLSIPTLPTTTSLALVDPNASNAIDDTDLTTPFVTIQAGYDAIVNAGGTYGVVKVRPGYYGETVYIRKSVPVAIVGETASGDPANNYAMVEIGSSGNNRPSIVISEATQASLETLFNGGVANFDANYESTLVSDSGSGVPPTVILENLLLWPTGFSPSVALFAGGVDSGSNFLDGIGLVVRNCQLREGSYVRLGYQASFIGCATESGSGAFYNLSYLYMSRCSFQGATFRYSTAVNEPSSGHSGYYLDYSRFFGTYTNFYGTSQTKAEFCGFDRSSSPAVRLFDTAGLELQRCRSKGITLADGTLVNAEGSTVVGALTFAGTTPLCTFKDCYVESVSGESATRYAVSMSPDEYAQLTAKTTPVAADLFVIEDSAAGFAKKKLAFSNLAAYASGGQLMAMNETVDGATSSKSLGGRPFTATSSVTFTVVLSVSVGTLTGTVKLYNVTDAEFITSAELSTSNTTPTKLTAAVTVGAGAGEMDLGVEKIYEVWIENDGTLTSELVLLGSAELSNG